MRPSVFWAFAACVAAVGLSACPSGAESFVSHALTSNSGYRLTSIDGQGNVAIESDTGCSSGDLNRCFELLSGGQLAAQSGTLTGFAPEDGVACSFTPKGTAVHTGQPVCKGGNHVVGVRMNGAQQIVYLSYTGKDFVTIGTADLLFVNTAGDFVLTDGLDGEIREFTPSPEPGTLVMLATALLGVAALTYRRTSAEQ